MNTSEKLKLLRQIAEKLSVEEWNIVSLTLEEFGIKVSRPSKASTFNYILQQIQNIDQEILKGLAAHLEIKVEENSEGVVTFWKKGKVKLFISHLARKKVAAAELREHLDKFAISSFVAHEDIAPSKEWQNEIENALITCDALVALMEKGFHKSYWTDHEVGFAFGRGLPIIPVFMGEMPYGIIGKIQACKFESVEKLGESIFKLLIADNKTSKKMSCALMEQFENSNSFAASAYNLRLLRKAKYWDDELAQRLKIAPKKNDQIRGSFDVPEGVKALIKKIKAN